MKKYTQLLENKRNYFSSPKYLSKERVEEFIYYIRDHFWEYEDSEILEQIDILEANGVLKHRLKDGKISNTEKNLVSRPVAKVIFSFYQERARLFKKDMDIINDITTKASLIEADGFDLEFDILQIPNKTIFNVWIK
jgi:hypothetical protein